MAVPGLGPEVGDAYIEVHADTKKFRRELQQRLVKEMVGYSKKAQKTFGDYLSLDEAADWESFHRSLARAARTGDFSRLQKQFKDTGDWVGEVAKRIDGLKNAWIEERDENDKVERRRKMYKVDEINRIRKALGLYVQELQEAGDKDIARFYRKLASRYEDDYDKFTEEQRKKRLKIEKFYTDLANKYEKDYKQQKDTRRKTDNAIGEFYRKLGRRYEDDYARFRSGEDRKRETRDRMTRIHANALREEVTREQSAAKEILAARKRITDELLFQQRTADPANVDKIAAAGRKVREELERATEDQRRELGARQEDWDRYITHLRTTILSFRALEKTERAAAARREKEALRVSATKYSVFFDGMRKSRSELIHGIAVVLDWVATAVGKTFEGVGRGIEKFFGYFAEGGGGFKQMFSDIAGSMKGFKVDWIGIAVTIGAIASSLGVIGVLTGVLISLASGLAAIIVGIASSLGMALLSLVPMAGMFVGIAFGAGLLVAAFKDMDQYLPGVSGALEELKRVFTEVDVPAFAAGVSGPLKDLFTSLAESLENDAVAGALGRAFGGIITALDGVVNSAGWKSFMDALETTIPAGIEGLGTGLAGVFEGLFSAFGAGGPAVEKMGLAFQAFGENFAATMAEMDKSGRLDDFFNLAADSMIVVSDLAWSVGEALVGLFEAAGPAGNELLKDITGLVKQFTEWVTSAEGKNQVAEWMEHGRAVADKLWEIIKEVGIQLKRLDTPENREWALSMLNAVRGIITGVGNLLSLAGALAQTWEKAYTKVNDAFMAIKTGIGDAWQGISDKWNEFLTGWTTFWDGVDWGTLGSDIWQGFLDGINSAWTGFTDQIRTMFEPFLTSVKNVLGISSPSTVFEQFGKDVVAGFRKGIDEAWTAFKTWFAGLLTGMVDGAKKTWGNLEKDVTTAWTNITTAIQTKVGEIRTNLSTRWEEMRTAVSTKVESIRTDLASKWESIRVGVNDKWNQIKTAITNKWNEIKSGTSTKIQEIVTLVGGIPQKAVNAMPNVLTTLYQSGKDLIEGFLSGMRVKIQSVVETARDMAGAVVTAVSKRLGMKSPSKVFERLGVLTAMGYQQGLEKQQAAVQASLVRMVAPPNINVPGLGGNLGGTQAFGNSRTVNVSPGAIQINTRATNPALVAGMVLDDMASRMMGV